MEKQFLVFSCIGGRSECMVIDKKRNRIVGVKNGLFEDITDKCKKMYDKEDKKPSHKLGKKLGGLWYKYLINECDKLDAAIRKDSVIIETDNQKDFDIKLFELRKEQIELIIKSINRELKNIEEKRQYYTYAFSNC